MYLQATLNSLYAENNFETDFTLAPTPAHPPRLQGLARAATGHSKLGPETPTSGGVRPPLVPSLLLPGRDDGESPSKPHPLPVPWSCICHMAASAHTAAS